MRIAVVNAGSSTVKAALADVEPDEAFILELVTDTPDTQADIFLRIAVMIRDDDS